MKEKFLFGSYVMRRSATTGALSDVRHRYSAFREQKKKAPDGSLSVGCLFNARGDVFLKKVSEGRRSLFRHIHQIFLCRGDKREWCICRA